MPKEREDSFENTPPPPETVDRRSSLECSNPLLEQFIADLERADDPDIVQQDYCQRHPDRCADLEQTYRFWKSMKANLKAPVRADGLPPQFGDFEIIREIDRGGMGIVYEAQQRSLERRVAIKTLQDFSATERFRNEQKCLAQFFLANIIPLYEAGEYVVSAADAPDGEARCTPYLVMPYVNGATLDNVVATANGLRNRHGEKKASSIGELANLSAAQSDPTATAGDQPPAPPPTIALELGDAYFRSVAHCMIEIAKAIQASHDVGIVHRDLKPKNVMVSREGHAFIIDFGLASPLGAGGNVRPRQGSSVALELRMASGALGTPGYAAPEQFQGQFNYQTDVWGLGCILYELLAFHPAYETSVRNDPPAPARTSNASVPRDLDAIALKCLQLQPERRYKSALALAEDLERWLHDLPVYARTPGPVERSVKWVRRHRVASVLIGAGLIGACLTATALLYHNEQLGHLNKSLTSLVDKLREEKRRAYAWHLSDACESWRQGRIANAVDLLRLYEPRDADQDLRGWEWFAMNGACQADIATLRGHQAGITCIAYTPAGGRLVSGDASGQIRVWNHATRECERSITAHEGEVTAIAVSHNGAYAISAGVDANVTMWSLTDGKKSGQVTGHILPVSSVVFHPNEMQCATAGEDGIVKLWSGAECKEFAALQHSEAVRDIGYSRDGTRLLVLLTRKIIVWDIARRERLAEISTDKTLSCASFTADEQSILGAGSNGSIMVWDTSTSEMTKTIGDDSLRISQLQVCRDGRRFMALDRNVALQVYDLSSGHLLRTFQGHRDKVHCFAIDPNDDQFVSGSQDRSLKLWSLKHSPEMSVLAGHAARIKGLAFDASGTHLASGSYDQSAAVWDLAENVRQSVFGEIEIVRDAKTGLPASITARGGHAALVMDVAFDPMGQRVASAGFDGSVRLWHAQSGEELQRMPHGGQVVAVAFSPDGTRVASAAWDDMIYVWDVESGELLHKMAGHSEHPTDVVYSPDGKQVASAGQDGSVRLWNVNGDEITTLHGHRGTVRSLAWSRDGQWIASGGEDQTIVVWNARNMEQHMTLRGHAGTVDALSFHPTESRLASAGSNLSDEGVSIWDLQTGNRVAVFFGASPVAFGPLGDKLAFRGAANSIQVWNAAYGAGLPTATNDPVPADEIPPRSDFQIPQDGGLRTLGYYTTTSLPNLRNPRQPLEAGEGEQFYVVVMSVPARLLRPPPAVYQKLVASDRSEGKVTAEADRISVYLPGLFSLKWDSAEPTAAEFLADWPTDAGFVTYMARTRSEKIPNALRVAMAVAWRTRRAEPASTSVCFQGRDFVPVSTLQLELPQNQLADE